MKSDLLVIIVSLLLTITLTTAQTFKCSTTATCQSLIDYVSPNATTLSEIKTLFGVKNLRSILGANNLPLSTSQNHPVPAKNTIKIPFPCKCSNGSGISNSVPVYTVKLGDGLDHIARDIFAGLLKYEQIVSVNNITNPNLIQVGQKLWIPLPCSCDPVNGTEVVHYGHVVAKGSTVEGIALEFGTSAETLLSLNGLADANKLQAGDVLDVPMSVCTSTINNTSADYPLLVPKDTYTLTANNCVQCKCGILNNSTLLQCVPSLNEVKVTKWSQCPSMQCKGAGALTLGNTSYSAGCNAVCSYAGYTTNETILTTLVTDPTCAANGVPPPGSHANKIGMRGSNWSWFLASLHLGLLFFGLV
ncbi:hypothetical protein GIB67_006946 [Kingdonia uniflora]|uniref:LysM domain-containing protein n=1 Tax=Kingdonia uniflora TaxID=39325 RepID=A0A7J7NZC3_9MAGN|nr:hypothetical protein GIB67_006946 [Kingdonia uniflora]